MKTLFAAGYGVPSEMSFQFLYLTWFNYMKRSEM